MMFCVYLFDMFLFILFRFFIVFFFFFFFFQAEDGIRDLTVTGVQTCALPIFDANSLRSLDPEENSFTFDLFQLHLHSNLPEGVSIATKLDFGKTASRIASDWDGDGALSNSEETNDFEVEEAFLAYAPDWAGGGSVKFGKFVTLLGAEVIEAPANPNFTRSFSFGYAIPFTHTGLLFSAPLGDMFSLSAGVVNGWDNVVDNND